MGRNKIVDGYNAIVPTMNKLLKEGYDVWEFHGALSGFGFKVICDKYWIEVVVSDFDDKPHYFITKYKRNGNVFSITDKTLGENGTTVSKNVYALIKDLMD